MEKQNWIWMPHAAHFICADMCRFHLATYVGKYIVSSVGEYWPDSEIRKVHAEIHDPEWYRNHLSVKGDAWDYAYMKRFGFEEIGAARTYETMVFAATTSDDECCPYRISDYHTLDSDGYNDAASAYRGHLALCDKWSKN